MKGTLVFDHLNDIVYLNCCSKFVDHVAQLAATQGLVASEHSTPHGRGRVIDPNILVQLFSPLVTSQRFMREQFGNPYTSVQCADGTNIVFEDYMNFLFLRIGTEDISYLRRALGVCTSFVTYICGPDVSMLKASSYHAELLDSLLTTWTNLYNSDQSFMIEAVEQMIINSQLNASLIKSLQQISQKIQSQVGDHVHALLFLETKLLSWFSTRGSFHLTPEDILFLMLVCQKTWKRDTFTDSTSEEVYSGQRKGRSNFRFTSNSSTETESSEARTRTYSNDSQSESTGFHSSRDGLFEESDIVTETHSLEEKAEEATEDSKTPSLDDIFHYLLLFKSDRVSFVPQVVHIGMVQDGLYLVLVCEPATSAVTTALCTALQVAVEFHGSRREPLRDKQYNDLLESSCKKIIDLLKKQKNIHIRNELQARWDRFKIGFQQYLKTKDGITIQLNPIIDILIEGFRKYFNEKILNNPQTGPESTGLFGYKLLGSGGAQPLDAVWKKIKSDTEDFWEFLKVKANRNVTMGAKDTLTINKYLEEFPGLVHFIYIDRNKHMVTMPALDYTREDSVKLTKRKIWAMVRFARDHMQQGHFSIMWKDTAFNYAYFLWFEDVTGQSIRPKQPPALPWDGYPLPGIMCGDFYKRLMLECFPSTLPSKIRCLELFCIHLGLATSSCVLEHSKRLATTICDLTGNNPTADLL